MPTTLAPLIDHARCRPGTHTTTTEPCPGCGQPLTHCAKAAAANDVEPGYQRVYIHTNGQESC